MEELPKSKIEIIFDPTSDGMIAVKSDGVVSLFTRLPKGSQDSAQRRLSASLRLI